MQTRRTLCFNVKQQIGCSANLYLAFGTMTMINDPLEEVAGSFLRS
jgi:hypothetical protein